jgi:hypothetical protein
MSDSRTISTIAIGVLIVVLLWDAYLTAKVSRDTISNVISTFNASTGGLVALAFAALWIHWFLPLPKAWITDDFRNPEAF